MLQSYQEVVNISDIQKASQKMFNSVIHQGVADATDMEALLFVSLASLQKQWARSKGGFGLKDVVTKMEGVASSFGDRRYLPSPTCSELLRMLNRLGEVSCRCSFKSFVCVFLLEEATLMLTHFIFDPFYH